MATDTAVLLDLLREAGDEAVTLDELAIAGVRDPARALRALEEAGHAVQRLHDNRFACVRLAPAATSPPPAPVPVLARPEAAAPSRIPAAGMLGGLALLLVVAAGARRAIR